MNFKKLNKNQYLVRFQKGEYIMEGLKSFCEQENVFLGEIRALGAVDFIDILVYNPATKTYVSSQQSSIFEITNLYGNISKKDNEVYFHIHATFAGEDFSCVGGHLKDARISATLEAVVDVQEGEVTRKFNDEVGLNLWNI